jgi:hypothetical protein
MITSSNYFEHSSGVFKIQPTTWAGSAISAVSIEVTYGFDGVSYDAKVRTDQEPVRLGNRNWLPNFVSYSITWGSLSAYWVSEDGQYLLRVSDHWSSGPVGVYQCGNIAKCWWELAGRRQPACYANPGIGNKMLWAGIIKLSDLKEV